jgi:hypothetical protein
MTEALEKISGTAATGKKEGRSTVYRQGKLPSGKPSAQEGDSVDISEEARKKSGSDTLRQ